MGKNMLRILNKIKIGIIALPLIFSRCNIETEVFNFDKGEIYGKKYVPAQKIKDYYLLEGLSIPHTRYVDEEYLIKIKEWDERAKTFRILDLKVFKEQYDTLKVGDTFNLDIPINIYFPYVKK